MCFANNYLKVQYGLSTVVQYIVIMCILEVKSTGGCSFLVNPICCVAHVIFTPAGQRLNVVMRTKFHTCLYSLLPLRKEQLGENYCVSH